jgi:hypothetical protein
MSDLIIILVKAIDADKSVPLRGQYFIGEHPLVSAVSYLANRYLIGDESYEHIENMKKNGYDVYPGEHDRFGWLTGCIKTERGIIIFG